MSTNEYTKTSTNASSQYVMGVACDDNSNNWSRYTVLLDRNSRKVQELENEGYKIIFPAELSQQAVDKMEPDEKEHYEINKRLAMIVDSAEDCHSLDLARDIATHYYSNCAGTITGVDYEQNALAIFPYGDYDPNTHQELHKIYSELGYTASLDGEQLSINSDEPYYCVTKSKFQQIYFDTKDKLHTMIENMSTFIKNSNARTTHHVQSL